VKPYFLTRVELRRDAPIAALRQLLVPSGSGDRTAAGHRLVWILFDDGPDRERDFLWREGKPGEFFLLSPEAPRDEHGLFHMDAPREFNPDLRVGDRLRFALRANATVARRAAAAVAGGRARSKRHDVVMDALRSVPKDERAAQRPQILQQQSAAWLAGQGERHGFSIEAGSEGGPPSVGAASYQVVEIDRGRGAGTLKIGVLDLEGVLTVREPEAFQAALRAGFGRARGFGCGLMLIRRDR
jgi:CRISPR system Cascade subunit CasE